MGHVYDNLDLVMIPIDPISALEGLEKAVSLVKKAQAVAKDIGGLSVMVGRLFDAESNATKSMLAAKKNGGKSNFEIAMRIENALMNSRNLQKELQLLYMQTGNIDVYNKMMARKLEMDRDDAIEARKLKEQEKKRKEAEEEQMMWAAVIVIIVLFLGAVGWGIAEITDLCAKTKCGR
jgi:conjugal transfer/entry exclusion protein